MDWSTLLPTLRQGLEVVRQLEPIVGALGGPVVGGAANVAGGLAEIALNALQRAETVQDAMSTEDQAELRTILAELQARNDQVDAAIRRT